MAYYNRKKLLENTLYTIQDSDFKDLEIIIVDDASCSEEKINDAIKNYNLDIKLIEINQKEKSWTNPCIPNNIGFKQASGDVIVLQNPECVYRGNILKHVNDNIKKNTYINYACYSLDKNLTEMIRPDYTIILPKDKVALENGVIGWYNHSSFKKTCFNFCSAILKEDLYELGGFDERYANGIAYDDNELLTRIQKKKMNIVTVDFPFVMHQFHEQVADENFVKEGMNINYSLWQKTLKSEYYDIKKHNKYYN